MYRLSKKQKDWIARLLINFIAAEVIAIFLYLFDRAELAGIEIGGLTISSIVLIVICLYLTRR